MLIEKWGFPLATASAILSVLYPDAFTIYDVRVRRVLMSCRIGDFGRLGQRRWAEKAWRGYLEFVEAIRAAAPQELSRNLRDCDQLVWGKGKQDKLRGELSLPLGSPARASPRAGR